MCTSEVPHCVDNQVLQVTINEPGWEEGEGSAAPDLHELGRGDRAGAFQSGPYTHAGECAAVRVGVQARAAHEGADVTQTTARESWVE